MGFGQGLSGLNAAAQNLDVIGNNIANSGTVGFKAGTATFADVYANSRVGLGTSVASINQRFTVGTVSSSGNQFDMAIDGPKGLFRVQDTSGNILFTRNGQFFADKNNFVVNAQGQRLTGYQGNGTDLVPITVPVGNIAPLATTSITMKANLDANAAVVPAAPAFNPDEPSTYTHSLPTSIYDSLGNSHQLTQYFVKRDGTATSSSWEVHYRLDGQALPTPAGSSIAMTFDDNGVLTAPTGPVPLTFVQPGGTAAPAAPLSIGVAYTGTTQFGGEFSASRNQNGYATGEYASMSIASDGAIVASYTNGETLGVGFLALADFNNVQGLQPVGGNAWAETSESGQPVVGRPGTNGMASIVGQSVEESNVDMSQELVNMIIAQRTYQANAQTIKTQDQVLQTLINLR
ncbi:flagellar biosynthesis protein FlgE [Pollutimonas nitritireducens]|uniref:Flagellar hook protein FlgE n=1 Tax=Pollutimonas nitritireducens TaxID=2045209 RepID=A0A2N4UB27_9BURK|nr:flagellar hook protein FlgE [Pollutimonas nitritireducens]PLC52219.1 flagellar biosynthesis protein FlgE [Pollutimonas nitritireducens]